MAEMVRRMLQRGWLQRRRSKEDARGYKVRVTERGLDLISRATPVSTGIDMRLLDALPAANRQRFIGDLQRIIQHVDGPNSRDESR